jgi:hypothetical protein
MHSWKEVDAGCLPAFILLNTAVQPNTALFSRKLHLLIKPLHFFTGRFLFEPFTRSRRSASRMDPQNHGIGTENTA